MDEDNDSKQTNLEKISLNIAYSELGRIDTLIEAGITTNRTEFIRNAIRKELNKYEDEIETIAPKKYFAVGLVHLSKKDVEAAIENGKKLQIRVIGYLRVSKNIKPEDLDLAVHSCKVYGTISTSIPLKKILLSKRPRYSLLGREYENDDL